MPVRVKSAAFSSSSWGDLFHTRMERDGWGRNTCLEAVMHIKLRSFVTSNPSLSCPPTIRFWNRLYPANPSALAASRHLFKSFNFTQIQSISSWADSLVSLPASRSFL